MLLQVFLWFLSLLFSWNDCWKLARTTANHFGTWRIFIGKYEQAFYYSRQIIKDWWLNFFLNLKEVDLADEIDFFKTSHLVTGTVDIDFETEPLGKSSDGTPIFLRDIYPTRSEIHAVEQKYVIPAMFQHVYSRIQKGSEPWTKLEAPSRHLYPWDDQSTYIKRPPFFDDMTKEVPPVQSVHDAAVLLYLGDSVTTDHISPAGSIARNSPAARYLASRGWVTFAIKWSLSKIPNSSQNSI